MCRWNSATATTMAEGTTTVEQFVSKLGQVLQKKDAGLFSQLFLENGWYRDLLVSSWQFHSIPASQLVPFFANRTLPDIRALKLEPGLDVLAGASHIGGGETFHTAFVVFDLPGIGNGRGVMRLKEGTSGELRIYTLLLGLHELEKHLPPTGPRRPLGTQHHSGTARTNWLDRREAQREFVHEEPTVVVVGAGQGGLMVAARLGMGGVSCLLVEKNQRVGDSWRKRYKSLVLHDPVQADHFPFLPYPANWPIFTPKDKLANWFEFYVEAMELNVWTGCTILPGTSYDAATGLWSVPIRRADGVERTLHPKHVVQATGASGEPNIPRFRNMDTFSGTLVHSSGHEGGEKWQGKKVVIVGCCNSAHDIAQDLYEYGAHVTMVQRSETLVLTSNPGLSSMLEGMYEENAPFVDVEDADLVHISTPILLLEKMHQALSPALHKGDKDIHDGLTKAGFKVDMNPSGLFIKYYRRGGGYYIDVGCSSLIAEGKIKVKQGVEIDEIVPDGVKFKDGVVLPADLVVLATGYDAMNTTCEKIFGRKIAHETGEVWGVDREGEIKGIWRNSGHPCFWYMGGNFQLARSYSRFLTLQIMAIEDGLMPREGVLE
ncbi:pyridine nucleotide-disulfide oxidoreductase family protein [Calocera viscosa TUFC12733]|uniref:Pyridine nucleotide-disulfide oxidoreductase family protein n=1 Tax=Calocera viscosa (strain TUFC12733) TaxID=1330018 RepID=A0A167LER5_CALVF|nr:pyridine nucleotide-disulfide oxidoreductase family protein [Calocera viscosa TUFC12733]